MTNDKTYTIKEVCEILHKHRRTVYAYIRSGQLRAVKPGGKNFLIYETDLNAFIKKGVQPGYYQNIYPRPHRTKEEHTNSSTKNVPINN